MLSLQCMTSSIFLNITCLLSVYNLTCIYFFKADDLILDNQLVYFCLGRTILFTLNIPWLPVVLYVELRSCGLSLVYFGISIVIFVQLKFMQSRWRDFMGVVSQVSGLDSFTITLRVPGFYSLSVICP